MSPDAVLPSELATFLAGLGIATATVVHEPLFTVEESQRHRGAIPGAHTKNLFLKDKKGRLFLVSALEETEIDLKHLHRHIGASGRLSFADPEAMRQTLGVTPGSVTLFGLLNDRPPRISVVLDRQLLDHALINCHPLANTATTTIGRDDLLAFIRATGHQPQVLAFPPPPPAEL